MAFGFPFKLCSLPWATVNGQNRGLSTICKSINTWVCLCLGFPTYCCMVGCGCRICFLCSYMQQFYLLSSCKVMAVGLVKLGHFVLLTWAYETFVLFCFVSGNEYCLNRVYCEHYFLQFLIFAIHRWKLSTLKILFFNQPNEYFCNFMILFCSTGNVFSMRISVLWLPTVCGQLCLYCFLPINTFMKLFLIASISFSIWAVLCFSESFERAHAGNLCGEVISSVHMNSYLLKPLVISFKTLWNFNF